MFVGISGQMGSCKKRTIWVSNGLGSVDEVSSDAPASTLITERTNTTQKRTNKKWTDILIGTNNVEGVLHFQLNDKHEISLTEVLCILIWQPCLSRKINALSAELLNGWSYLQQIKEIFSHSGLQAAITRHEKSRKLVNPWSAEIFFKNHGCQRDFCQFKITINGSVSSFYLFQYLCYGSTAIINILILTVRAPDVYRRQILTSKVYRRVVIRVNTQFMA